jgi:hypothetical protein
MEQSMIEKVLEMCRKSSQNALKEFSKYSSRVLEMFSICYF